MKRAVLLISALLLCFVSFSQSPQLMSYQAVIRDASDQLVTSQVGMQISILHGTIDGTVVYSETQTPTPNINGLVTIEIGGGTVVSGDFTTIDWSVGPYFIKTQTDPSGGTTYTITGTNQLLSVPYALHAKTAEMTTGDSIWKKSANNIYYNGNVGIGTADPTKELEITGTVKATAFEGNGSLLTSVDASTLNGIQSDEFINNADYEKYNLENLIDNASFEIFSSGDDACPDSWSILGEEGGPSSISRNEPGYFGSSAIKIMDGSASGSLGIQQEIYSESALPPALLNETITFSVWARKDIGIAIGEIAISDGSTRTVSSLSDSPSWNRVTLSHVIAPDASKLVVELSPTLNDPNEVACYIFDGVMLVTGPYTPSFSLNTLDQLSTEKLQVSDLTVSNSVGVGTSNPNSSAILDLESTTKGFLPPRMTMAQRDAIAAPAQGMIIYCTDCGAGEIETYNGFSWLNLLGSAPAGHLVLNIGDSYGGGIVAYILQPGDPDYIDGQVHGLIAATSDQSTSIQWYNGTYTTTGAIGTTIGTGMANTNTIITSQGAGSYAAKICRDYTGGGYTDWYLPGKDELNKLYLNKDAIGGFTSIIYWSSSEINTNEAWGQNFNDGAQGYPVKFSTYYVRAVRAF